MTWDTVLVAGIIFLARCTDVTMGVFRILMLVKGRKFSAACLGFFEVMVFIMVMNTIMGGGKSLSIPEMFAYCGGFAVGNIVGSLLEAKLSNSYAQVEIILAKTENAGHLAERLRGDGFGTTVLTGEGRDGPTLVLKVLCFRKQLPQIREICRSLGGFVFISDIKGVFGGHFLGHFTGMHK